MKEINVKNLSEEEMIENLEIEENIENAYKKEGILKTLGIIVIVFSLLYGIIVYAIDKPNLEDIRKENLRKANEYLSGVTLQKNKYQKLIDIYDTRISQANWCIEHNSNTGSATDCFIFNK